MPNILTWLLRLLGVEDDTPTGKRWEDGTPRPKVWMPPTTLADDVRRLKYHDKWMDR